MIPAKILANSFSPFADAAEIIFGHWGKLLIGIGAIISCFGALNGWTLLVGQVGKSASNMVFQNLWLRVQAWCSCYIVNYSAF